MVEFEAEGHKYFLGEIEVPSVSEITSIMSTYLYKDADIPECVLEDAAVRGTAVHEAAESLDLGMEIEIEGDYADYVLAYVKFVKEKKPEWEKIEHIVHDDVKYAGRLDRLGVVGGKRCILDIKTCKTISKQKRLTYQAALNLYRMAWEKDTGEKLDALYLLQLLPDGTYKLIECEIEDELANACLVLHNALTPKKRKKVD